MYASFKLIQLENWVALELNAWLDARPSAENLATCREPKVLIEQYHGTAKPLYKHNPEAISVTFLILLELWVAIDKTAVMTTESECPQSFSLEEYKALASLPLGFRIEWQNILVQLASPVVSFSKDDTFRFVLQCSLHAGPSDGKGVLRVSLLSRVASPAANDAIRYRCLEILAFARTTSDRWFDTLRQKARDVVDEKSRNGFHAKEVFSALLCAASFNLEQDALSQALSSLHEAAILLKSIIVIRGGSNSIKGETVSISALLRPRWENLLTRSFLILLGTLFNNRSRAFTRPSLTPGLILTTIGNSVEERTTITGAGRRRAKDVVLDYETLVIDIDLPRLQLNLSLKPRAMAIDSRQFRGMQIDKIQEIGTLIGLRNKMVLKSFRSSSAQKIIIPDRNVSYTRSGGHVLVTLGKSTASKVKAYDIDKLLGRLVDNWSLQSELFLSYLHAVTTFCLPDPLTGTTGTKMSLMILSSAATRPSKFAFMIWLSTLSFAQDVDMTVLQLLAAFFLCEGMTTATPPNCQSFSISQGYSPIKNVLRNCINPAKRYMHETPEVCPQKASRESSRDFQN
ncbi:hypothetical protein F4859DRAFT_518447 [Xylaria cf. heliscus]|nr:hypothetical protein F4859DRAFT_518447 [Xylaria cf. heliscus]